MKMKSVEIKIHKQGVVSLCDSELIGKKFEEGDIDLQVYESFYKGRKMDEKDIVKVLKEAKNLNIVGKRSVELALKSGTITKEGVRYIQNVPVAQFYCLE